MRRRSLFYSRAAQYAVQAVLFLAMHPEGKLVRVREISSELDIPAPFLAQIFHKLARLGVLTSMKGPTGGFTLARSPSEIRVADIVSSVDGKDVGKDCVLGLKECTNEAPCPFHERWSKVRDEFMRLVYDQRLSDLTDSFRRKLELRK
jgi:Rrf2 family protein